MRFETDVLVSVSVEVEAGGEKAARALVTDWTLRNRTGIAQRMGRYFIKGWSSDVKRIERKDLGEEEQ
jgi:hypothetical protein